MVAVKLEHEIINLLGVITNEHHSLVLVGVSFSKPQGYLFKELVLVNVLVNIFVNVLVNILVNFLAISPLYSLLFLLFHHVIFY